MFVQPYACLVLLQASRYSVTSWKIEQVTMALLHGCRLDDILRAALQSPFERSSALLWEGTRHAVLLQARGASARGAALTTHGTE